MVLILIAAGIAALPLLALTAVVEHLTKQARPDTGCGCGGRCRGR